MDKTPSILIIDDNEELLCKMNISLASHFDEIKMVKNPKLIPSVIQKETYDIILLNMNFTAGINTGNEGLFWMHKIIEFDPTATIILGN